MTAPSIALQRFAIALALGAGLGLYYGFLRPLRPRHTALSDLLFLPGLFWVWLYLGFGVCQGDLRLGYSLGLLCGGLLWELTLGRLLRPFFAKIWQAVGAILGFFVHPFKILLKKAAKFAKNLLATAKKRFRIKCKASHNDGGIRYGSREKSVKPHPTGLPAQLHADKVRGHRRHRTVHRRAAGPAQRDRR